MNSMKIHIGIDDTDYKGGMCTTYLGAVLKDRLACDAEINEIRLVRLNPNIPWKTRGNGAVSLTLESDHYDWVVDETLKAVEQMSTLKEEGTNPGAVFLKGDVGKEAVSFYHRALHGIVTVDEAERLAEKHCCEIYRYNNGRGIIGALAAVGARLSEHTYESITYRRKENWGRSRKVDHDSVFEMDQAMHHETFNNVDREHKRILITPRSPCPVLFGIRGMTEDVVERARRMVRIDEPADRHAVFRSNQCTDAHLVRCNISEVEPYSSVIVDGTVLDEPKILQGGHVVVSIGDNGSRIDCAAYEPTGAFREVVKKLRPGDAIRAFGGVKNTRNLTVNLEKIEVLNVAEQYGYANPLCPGCNNRMKSAGSGQGFRCTTCKTKASAKISEAVARDLKTGLYCVPPRAMRHLSKPLADGGSC